VLGDIKIYGGRLTYLGNGGPVPLHLQKNVEYEDVAASRGGATATGRTMSAPPNSRIEALLRDDNLAIVMQ